MTDLEYRLVKTRWHEEKKPQVRINHCRELNLEARLAVVMVEKWGMVAAEDGGEDSKGRHKLRLSTPEELVSRAVDCASRLYQEIDARGWILRTPTYSEIDEWAKQQEKDEEKA